MKSVGIFVQFSESSPGKYVKSILQEMKNGLSLISSLADKNNAPRNNEQYFYLSLRAQWPIFWSRC